MSTRTLPDHGKYSRYVRHGCRCDHCRAAGRSYRLRLAYDHTNGVARRVDSTQVRVHLERLTAHDWTQNQIAAAAGIDQSTVSLIMSRPGTRVRRSTAAAILDIRLDQTAPVPRGLVDATGSRRRLQALMVLGHTISDIARRIAVPESSLQQTVEGRWERIRSVTATKVTRVYRQLSVMRAPQSRFAEQARNEAMARGWYGPMAWDDIDDPACVPDPTEPAAPASVHPADVSELAGRGLNDAEIGRRLGVSPRTVLRARTAHGIPAGVAA